jgi:hypothetical protein
MSKTGDFDRRRNVKVMAHAFVGVHQIHLWRLERSASDGADWLHLGDCRDRDVDDLRVVGLHGAVH